MRAEDLDGLQERWGMGSREKPLRPGLLLLGCSLEFFWGYTLETLEGPLCLPDPLADAALSVMD